MEEKKTNSKGRRKDKKVVVVHKYEGNKTMEEVVKILIKNKVKSRCQGGY
ncbi:hypothetical protein [Alkaliphilus serpentinus]|nr:hypothetical protein [Alkaliphilus serpentinus]